MMVRINLNGYEISQAVVDYIAKEYPDLRGKSMKTQFHITCKESPLITTLTPGNSNLETRAVVEIQE